MVTFDNLGRGLAVVLPIAVAMSATAILWRDGAPRTDPDIRAAVATFEVEAEPSAVAPGQTWD